MTNGKLSHLPHFDAKADVAEYIREQKIPACTLNAGCFMSNFPGALQKVCDTQTDCSFRTETEATGKTKLMTDISCSPTKRTL